MTRPCRGVCRAAIGRCTRTASRGGGARTRVATAPHEGQEPIRAISACRIRGYARSAGRSRRMAAARARAASLASLATAWPINERLLFRDEGRRDERKRKERDVMHMQRVRCGAERGPWCGLGGDAHDGFCVISKSSAILALAHTYYTVAALQSTPTLTRRAPLTTALLTQHDVASRS